MKSTVTNLKDPAYVQMSSYYFKTNLLNKNKELLCDIENFET